MQRLRLAALAALFAIVLTVLTACTGSPSPTQLPDNPSAQPMNNGVNGGPACPTDVRCVVKTAKLVNAGSTGDGTCNYSPLGRGITQWHAAGIVEHTSEGSAESALNEIQDPKACLSWNYLVDTDGTVYLNVPPGNQVFSVNNRFFNTDYIQVENVGHASACDITAAEYKASAKLVAYLAHRYGFAVSASTVFGHDSVPGINDSIQASQHWDPGTCWDWNTFLHLAGAQVPAAKKGSNVVLIRPSFHGNNYVALHTAPSTGSPLVSDSYVHGGSTGTTVKSDWSDKAVTGHRYVVAGKRPGWTAIWYGGKKAWFQNVPGNMPVVARTVTPKRASVAVYGRPMPSASEFNASQIPPSVLKVQDVPAQLTRYSMKRGQSYVLVSSSVRNQFFEGCDKTNCSGPFDGTVVTGKEKYLQIEWNHRYVFVKASDVTVHSG